MNDLLTLIGINAIKPWLAALLLPPVPLLLLVLIGARLILPRRGLGWTVILLAVALLWFSACAGTERLLGPLWLKPPPALAPERIAAIRAARPANMAIVVLGGGAQPVAPEYGVSNLSAASLERLRYGIWLARQTGLPIAFSGGVGWTAADSAPEADIAARIATQEFGVALKWTEAHSRDTRQNAGMSVAMLRPAGISQVLLVTHDYHMPRAQRAFEQAGGAELGVEPAPMGLGRHELAGPFEWIPSATGFMRVRQMLRELGGLAVGA